jgi:hypothetical protein
VIRHFEELSDGALERFDDELGEDDIKMLKSRIAALEADIQKLKSGNLAGQDRAFFDQLLAAKIDAGSEISQISSLGKQASKEL